MESRSSQKGYLGLRRVFKYLGVFLGDEMYMQKNFEDIAEKVKGRLAKWKFLLPKMSYKGQVLIINNLIASALWHRLICVDPPRDLLPRLQSILIDFFWDKMHWVLKSILYLPKEEGGHGLNACTEQNSGLQDPVYSKIVDWSSRFKLEVCCLCHFARTRRPGLWEVLIFVEFTDDGLF